MRWLGGNLTLLDSHGDPLPTSSNFNFRLIGQTSGFNYANAVPRPGIPTSVAAPNMWAFATPLIALLLATRRRQARAPCNAA